MASLSIPVEFVVYGADSGSQALADSKVCVSSESTGRPTCQRDELPTVNGLMAAIPKSMVGKHGFKAGGGSIAKHRRPVEGAVRSRRGS